MRLIHLFSTMANNNLGDPSLPASAICPSCCTCMSSPLSPLFPPLFYFLLSSFLFFIYFLPLLRYLQGNGLVGEVPDLFNFTNIKEIHLQSNCLSGHVPQNIPSTYIIDLYVPLLLPFISLFSPPFFTSLPFSPLLCFVAGVSPTTTPLDVSPTSMLTSTSTSLLQPGTFPLLSFSPSSPPFRSPLPPPPSLFLLFISAIHTRMPLSPKHQLLRTLLLLSQHLSLNSSVRGRK